MNWNPISVRPDHDCEVFMLAEVLEDYYNLHKGQYVLQRDTYDAENDYFAMVDDERIRAICWCMLEFPDVPDIYNGKTETMHWIIRCPE